ncbi:pickpocket protein 11-like [Teleopsis dalmanni]|uniref:pickpocket protein 11-like n=1 Tax=Teleopsis dalmanni TaxID=139649 RepID=UPI0018CC7DE6|nr:pickpocket protein 11-like [Teleopsis dalmanni]
MSFIRKCLLCITDYCSNCTLAGLRYIVNHKLHITERLFWFICFVLSVFGSYSLISEYQNNFESKAVSIVYESLSPNNKIEFPTISVCDTYSDEHARKDIEEYVQKLGTDLSGEYNYDIEMLVSLIIYPTEHHEGLLRAKCTKYLECSECAQCPTKDYRKLAKRFTLKCSQLFINCSLSNKPFDCCQYFLPLITPFGKCFLLNSGSESWLDTNMDQSNDEPLMEISIKRPIKVSILNKEDLPVKGIQKLSFVVLNTGEQKIIEIRIDNTVNDADVRTISPEYRKCRFTDEVLPNTEYKVYSFSACLADCIRIHQLRICNCTLYTFLPLEKESIQECNFDGYLCLEKNSMVNPEPKSLMPWPNNKYTCDCLPSCTESDFNLIYESSSRTNYPRSFTIKIPKFPTEQFRRQALRTQLDVVVTIGGILGLFLGASILSGIEIIYHFLIRTFISYIYTRTVSEEISVTII